MDCMEECQAVWIHEKEAEAIPFVDNFVLVFVHKLLQDLVVILNCLISIADTLYPGGDDDVINEIIFISNN